jgi:hypothetical protein
VASWLFFFRRGGSLLTYQFRYARRSALKNSQLTDGESHVIYGTGH